MLPPALAAGAIIACSAAMLKAIALARRLAPLPRPVLLVGQSGVGKGLLVQFIHVESARAGDFVAVAGGELSESLLHDQLAGHEAGAFTGAHRRVRGAFERAQRGTLFLDELPLWSQGAQSAVLRAVDERLITRLGAERELPLDCRVVVASNRSLEELVNDGRLLSDLRWRIGEFVIEIPPLAGRAVDVAALSYHFLDGARAEFGGPGPVLFEPAALERLVTYHWPGNVRQLRGVVEWSWTIAAMDAAERIGVTHLPASVLRDEAPLVPLDSSTRHALSRWAYDRAGRSRKAAAELLGLHPNTIDNHRRAATR
jgi:DNA-binding NtrC family response regulator